MRWTICSKSYSKWSEQILVECAAAHVCPRASQAGARTLSLTLYLIIEERDVQMTPDIHLPSRCPELYLTLLGVVAMS